MNDVKRQHGRRSEGANQFSDLLDRLTQDAEKKGMGGLDFIESLPDNDVPDEPIPFPYGRGSRAHQWVSK
ncbi:MAG: hypothetical protein DHS20C01_01920 [marine bacterium B5-7]|nr:MAG: hypothetical protein DHS20C01_01920 [marine bacterium B5-7]